MNEKEIKDKCINFVEDLNKMYGKNCNMAFNNNGFALSYISKTQTINFDIPYSIEHEDELQLKIFESEDYYKYSILHEYGHFLYNKPLKDLFQASSEEPNGFLSSPLASLYEETVSLNFSTMKDRLEKSYVKRQYAGACEFIADYFVLKSIKQTFKNLDFSQYKVWRTKAVLDSVENQKFALIGLDEIHYYHIPEAINDERINFETDTIEHLAGLSEVYCYNILKLVFDQVNNENIYLTSKDDLIKKLKLLLGR